MSALTERYCKIQMLIMPVLQEEFYDLSSKAKEFAELLELAQPGKSWKKVCCHLMFGVIAIAAKQICNMLC